MLKVGISFIVGAFVFSPVALVFFIVDPTFAWWVPLFVASFLAVGLGLVVYVLRHRSERKNLACDGYVAMGSIEHIGRDFSVNDGMAHLVRYRFEVGGQHYTGTRTTMNPAVAELVEGDSIWVLHDRDDPSRSLEWPPL